MGLLGSTRCQLRLARQAPRRVPRAQEAGQHGQHAAQCAHDDATHHRPRQWQVKLSDVEIERDRLAIFEMKGEPGQQHRQATHQAEPAR